MSNRLKHSAGGFFRAMQMSETEAWIFVEGITDRSFVSMLYEACDKVTKQPSQICLVQELPRRKGNGKRALLGLYRYLRRRKALANFLGGKRTIAIFFLDKDLDDLTNRTLRSPQVVYTEHYCVENYLARHGDVVRAISTAASLDLDSVRTCVGESGIGWTARVAPRWSEWVAFCLMVSLSPAIRRRALPNYGVKRSPFHINADSTCCIRTVEGMLLATAGRTGLPVDTIRSKFRDAERYVSESASKGALDRVFNGKWYVEFLLEEAARASAGRDYHQDGLESRIPAALLATLDFRQAWAEQLRSRITVAASIEAPPISEAEKS